MISHADFGNLRLAQYRHDAEIAELDNWEFMDHMWIGEAVGFSEWLRPAEEPDVLRSLAIDFTEFPETAAIQVLGAIGLSVRAGMSFEELRKLLGEPVNEHRFVKDRVSYEFVVAGPPVYNLSCTVLSDGGLTYLVVMVPLSAPPNQALHLTGAALLVSRDVKLLERPRRLRLAVRQDEMKPRRHDAPSGRPELGEESTRDLESVSEHIARWWGDAPEVFHEIVSDYVHIDLTVVPASDDRPYHSVVTTGMSDRPMNAPEGRGNCRYCELLLALPPEWPIKHDQLADEKVWWPYRHLKQAARFPHVYDTWLWYGHSLANGEPAEPFADDVGFCAGILSIPVLCPKEAWSLRVREDKVVHFFSFIPIYETEFRYAWEDGSDALFDRLDDLDLSELVWKDRPCTV